MGHIDTNYFRELLNSRKEFSEDELIDFIDEYEVTREYGENRRWSRSVTSICEFDNKFYAIDWDEGLTEMQPDEYYDFQPYPVKPIEKQITVVEWVKI